MTKQGTFLSRKKTTKKKSTLQPGSKIERSEERIKKNGEIFTPPELVNEMLDKLRETDDATFTNKWKTVIDPACGSGNFLVEVLKRKLANKHPPLIALMTIYGIDIMEDNIEECRQRLLDVVGDKQGMLYGEVVKANIICGDALKDETRARFIDWQEMVKEKLKITDEQLVNVTAVGPMLMLGECDAREKMNDFCVQGIMI